MRKAIVSLLITICTAAPSQEAFAANLTVGDLPSELCGESYWYRRQLPLVGYKNGEQLVAGGDGTCVLRVSEAARILVNGKQVVLPRRTERNGKIIYESADRKTRISLVTTDIETTCVPDEDKCCGDYTFGTLTVVSGSQKAILYVVSYEGG